MIVTVNKNHPNIPFLAVVISDNGNTLSVLCIKNKETEGLRCTVLKTDTLEFATYKKETEKTIGQSKKV